LIREKRRTSSYCKALQAKFGSRRLISQVSRVDFTAFARTNQYSFALNSRIAGALRSLKKNLKKACQLLAFSATGEIPATNGAILPFKKN
jgi:hypothetical protein